MSLTIQHVGVPLGLLLAMWNLAAGATTADSVTCSENADQLLLISTRCYPCRLGQTLDLDTCWARELTPQGTLVPGRVALWTDQSFANVWIFVHGNQIPANDAIRRGLMVYRNMRRHDTVQGAIRFVIWSWPSERRLRRIPDSRRKVRRTDVEAFLLGSYLAKVSSSGPTSLVGYSFGSRIITGALHVAAGGSLGGTGLADLPESTAQFRVALMAAAVESSALLPGGRHCRALHRVDRLLLMNNSRDRALNFFWVVDPRRKPRALGDVGLSRSSHSCKVRQYDWASAIGREHSLMEYLNRATITRLVSRHVSR